MKIFHINVTGNTLTINHKNTTEEVESSLVFNKQRNIIEAIGIKKDQFIKDIIEFYANIKLDESIKYGLSESDTIRFKSVAVEDLKNGTVTLWDNLNEIYCINNSFSKSEFNPKLSALFILYLCNKLLYQRDGIIKQLIKSYFNKYDIDLYLDSFNDLSDIQINAFVNQLTNHIKLKRLSINNRIYKP